MTASSRRAVAIALPLLVSLAGRPIATEGQAPRHTEADAAFMRHMAVHHQQALEMTALVPARAGDSVIRVLARRIEISQTDEIRLIRRWLDERGGGPADHHPDAAVAGMLPPEDMAILAAARGSQFDRRFLRLMIRHHEGALTMVKHLFASPGAAQDAEVFQFASAVSADQEAEMRRMRRLLRNLPDAPDP